MKERGCSTAVVALASLVGFAAPADAQVGYLWTFEELHARAHAVVIAECLGTMDTGHPTNHPGFAAGLPAIEKETRFLVQAVVKSAARGPLTIGKELRLRHYSVDIDRGREAHPPKPGEPPPGIVNTGSALHVLENRSYLLFLGSRSDGLYEPLSGHTFPTDSVYLLQK